MDSAGAPTAVVTPPGDTATAPGAGAAELGGGTADGAAPEVDDDGDAGSGAEEQPADAAAPIMMTAATRTAQESMPPM